MQWSRFVTADASVTNGQGANALSNPNGLELLIGRVTVTPFSWLAVAAYNAGERTVDRYRGVPPYPETREYVRRVLGLFRERVHQHDPTVVAPSAAALEVAPSD